MNITKSVTTPKSQQHKAAKELLKAVRQRKWDIAFRLAYELRRSGTSHVGQRALKYFEQQALRFAVKAVHKDIGKKVAAALHKFGSKTKSPSAELLKSKTSRLQELKLKTSREGRSRSASGRGSGRVGLGRGLRIAVRPILEEIETQEPYRPFKGDDVLRILTHSEGPVKGDKTQIIERIPHMDFKSIEAEGYQVLVFANITAPDEGAEVEPIQLKVPENIMKFRVEISFACSAHFHLDGSDTGELIFVRDQPESTKALFPVTLIAPNDPSVMFFTALFRHNGRPSGKITRFLQFDAQARLLSWKRTSASPTSQSKGEVTLPRRMHTSNIPFDFTATSSDIQIEVLNTLANDGRSFDLRCYTPSGDWKGPWNLPQESKDLVKTYMDGFMTSKGTQSLARLKSAGVEFWNTVTKEARDCLKKAFTEHHIVTISVLSEEPYIPWELMVPVPKGSAPVPCLGVQYSMGRWPTGDFRAPAQSIPLRTAFIVAPADSGLKSAPKEVSFLKETFPGSTQVKPVGYDALNKKLATSKDNIIHFICHGETATLQTIQLDAEELLNCSEILALDGFLSAFRKKPFAFLNACEVGQPIRTLVGVGGFANSFIDLGASAVVAPLWSVDDTVALRVCKSLYADVLAGKTFGEAMKRIRARAFSARNDTYAAYCYYGDPAATRSTTLRN
jgi:hypothetical protein